MNIILLYTIRSYVFYSIVLTTILLILMRIVCKQKFEIVWIQSRVTDYCTYQHEICTPREIL